jgi:hypothetical protein
MWGRVLYLVRAGGSVYDIAGADASLQSGDAGPPVWPP